MSTKAPFVKYARGGGRQRKGGLDLNVPPPNENQEQAGGPTVSVSQTSIATAPTIPGSALPAPTPIDVEEFDDDVVISSPRAFEEAKKKSQRIRKRPLVVDVESEEVSARVNGHNNNHGNKRKRGAGVPPVINCEMYVNLEGGSSGSMRVRAPPPPPPPPPPPEPTFSCPVCMGSLVEEAESHKQRYF
ncbi:unnamed protein product [Lactuca saligna]|uniref:E3 ubiquitin-protein ligase RNF4 n=1 Tax=Lactuca saligna TaxID=75948 RepID=A0AA35ZYN8_LACSI|nr:unnamed protein product [Lactuca saligna]